MPLLSTWTATVYFRHKEDADMSYKFNTFFLRWFFFRLLLIIVVGAVFLISITQDDSLVNFFCDRYSGDYINDETDAIRQEKLAELDQCQSTLRYLFWLSYFPLVVFQAHCLQVLQEYRKQLNQDYIKEIVAVQEDEI